jgi:hypothetical protein
LTYADPTSLTSAVYLACVVFFLSFLLGKAGAAVMARRDNATAGKVGHTGIIAEEVAQQLTGAFDSRSPRAPSLALHCHGLA